MATISRARQPTFDVFDTVLTRAAGSPEAVFLLLGHRLAHEGLIKGSPEAFARARIAAEERAHRNLGARCTLDDIYREAAQALEIEEALLPAIEGAECEVESAVLKAVPAISQRLAAARARHGRIIFISDTYFPAAFVRERLAEHGLLQPEDRCYVSCEWGALKASGELYDRIEREEKARGDAFIHTGNDAQADGAAASARGWTADLFLEANPNRYERLLESSSYATDGLSTALAGASRLARLNVTAKSAGAAAIRDVTSGVVGPILTGYALWLLRRATAIGLHRLYFLARDGQVLLQIAGRLVERLGLDLELRYLYASRQAWNPAATFTGSPAELAWIWDTTDTLTAEMVLRRAGVPAEAVARELESAGLPRSSWNRQLAPAERDTLGRVLGTDAVKGYLLDVARQQRGLLLRYFDQEGLLEGVPYGVVDLGWYGSMQKALAAVLADAGHPAPPGFYFALHRGDIVDEAALHREAYYFDERNRSGYIDAVPNLIALMEMFCTADHGTTIGFEERKGKVCPVLQDAVNLPATTWGLPLLRGTLQAFVGNLFLDGTYLDPYSDVRVPLTTVLTEFSRHPSRGEAAVWGAFPWEDGLGADTVRNDFAQPYAPRDLIKAIKAGSVRPRHRAAWIEGSLALSSGPLRLALRGAGAFGRQRRALRAGFSRRRPTRES